MSEDKVIYFDRYKGFIVKSGCGIIAFTLSFYPVVGPLTTENRGVVDAADVHTEHPVYQIPIFNGVGHAQQGTVSGIPSRYQLVTYSSGSPSLSLGLATLR